MKTSRSTRVPAHSAAWRWCALVVVGVFTVLPGMARGQDLPATPPPIRSKDLERLLQAMEAGPEGRTAAVAAFDAYVDRWQRLRDETIRPLQASMAAALAKVPAMPGMEDAEELAGGVVHTAGAEADADGGELARFGRRFEPGRRSADTDLTVDVRRPVVALMGREQGQDAEADLRG